jgi:N-acylneuraminate cytidylyltransferase
VKVFAMHKNVLAVIPARGGSKGILRKNLELVAGKPLVAWSIEVALKATWINRVVVSTDDPEIEQTALAYGAEVVIRPDEISGDGASSESALLHVLETLNSTEKYRPDVVVFLQATSPVRTSEDIDQAVSMVENEGYDSVLSVVPSHGFLWREGALGAESVNYDWAHRPRRQDMKPEYRENGSIYVMTYQCLMKFHNRLGGRIGMHVMDETAGYEIDSPTDLEIVRHLMNLAGKERS